MVTKPRSVSTNSARLGHAKGEPVRDKHQQPAPAICLTNTGSGGDGSGRNVNILEDNVGVSVCPTKPVDPTSVAQATPGPSGDYSHSATLARSKMVRKRTRVTSGSSQSTPGTSRPTTAGITVALLPGPATVTRFSAILAALTCEGFSVASRAAQPQRSSTLAVYESKWRACVSWCITREVDPIATSAAEVVGF